MILHTIKRVPAKPTMIYDIAVHTSEFFILSVWLNQLYESEKIIYSVCTYNLHLFGDYFIETFKFHLEIRLQKMISLDFWLQIIFGRHSAHSKREGKWKKNMAGCLAGLQSPLLNCISKPQPKAKGNLGEVGISRPTP